MTLLDWVVSIVATLWALDGFAQIRIVGMGLVTRITRPCQHAYAGTASVLTSGGSGLRMVSPFRASSALR